MHTASNAVFQCWNCDVTQPRVTTPAVVSWEKLRLLVVGITERRASKDLGRRIRLRARCTTEEPCYIYYCEY